MNSSNQSPRFDHHGNPQLVRTSELPKPDVTAIAPDTFNPVNLGILDLLCMASQDKPKAHLTRRYLSKLSTKY